MIASIETSRVGGFHPHSSGSRAGCISSWVPNHGENLPAFVSSTGPYTNNKFLIDSAKNLVEGRSSKVIQEVQNLIWSKCSWSFVFAIGPQIVDTKIRMRMKGWHKKRSQAQDAEPS